MIEVLCEFIRWAFLEMLEIMNFIRTDLESNIELIEFLFIGLT